jgi:hypothetical protein
MISLFSTCKPFGQDPHIDVIQRNAITSWALLKPDVRPMLIGNDPGVRDICHELGIYFVSHVERADNTPLVRSLWSQAQELHMGDIFAYVNSDIILLPDFSDAVEAVAAQYEEFMVVGRRWNTTISEPIDFDGDWEHSVRLAMAHGTLYAECAMDYFVWRGDWWGDIPDYAVGRYVWDNWLLWKPLSIDVPVVDCTDSITAVHQSHAQLPWNHEQANLNRSVHAGGMCGLKDVRLTLVDGKIVERS